MGVWGLKAVGLVAGEVGWFGGGCCGGGAVGLGWPGGLLDGSTHWFPLFTSAPRPFVVRTSSYHICGRPPGYSLGWLKACLWR